MTPANPDALAERKSLRKAILAAIPVNVPLRGRYATAIMEQAVGPVLDDLKRVTAEVASLQAENGKLKQEIADTRTKLDALIQEVLKNG